ncbi:CueP family metal-binding protein [Photobacterium ganghwense]|uniref:CueP family metal-binding protein n=1 Tax=Photobacterium ganghwense TaxID=320778 RepID=UPI001A8C995C|nr:CueP family metal-binding protein [Photobacterium ganghwense]QSV14860.1 CueP family metal-binding protein [Photobacterium ganghwense]
MNFVSRYPLIVATLLVLSAPQAYAETQADTFRQLSAEDALEASHQWHHTGEASVKVYPDRIEASFADQSSATIPTGDQFLLSVAPYEDVTHGCTFHVPTGCQGEMVEKAMMVKITNAETQEVIQSGMVRTQKDGFIDFWLPKDHRYQFTFTYQGKTASEVLSTDANSRTCITTMQLL